MKKRDAFVLAGFKRNNLAEIVITTGMQTCHSYGKPAKVRRNLPDLVVRATRDHNRNAESARLLGTCQFGGTRDCNYNRNAEPARVMGNLPESKETCQS